MVYPAAMAVQPQGQTAWTTALRRLLADRAMTAKQLAEALDISAQTLTNRNTAAGGPLPSHVFAVEQALELEPGHLSRLLGYVPAEWDYPTVVADAVAADPNLSDAGRDAMLALYRSLTGQ